MIKTSRFLGAVVLTTWLYSLLIWLYVAARIVTNDHIIFDPFIYTIHWITFGELGAFSFILSSVSLFTYLYFWGIPNALLPRAKQN